MIQEVAPFLLVVCQLAFAAPEQPPKPAIDMVARSYGCAVSVEVNTSGVPAPPLDQVGAFFPKLSHFWPIMETGDQDTIDRWIDAGIRPGLLLPEDPLSVVLYVDRLMALREARSQGVVLVLPVSRPILGRVTYAATIYAALGLAPQSVYITDGFGLDLGLLPDGSHLVAPFWRWRNSGVPLPAQRHTQGSSDFLPLFQAPAPGGGTYAVMGEGLGNPFNARLRLRWQFLGIEYEASDTGLETSPLGHVVLGLTATSTLLWAGIDGNWPDLVTALVSLLAWIGIGVAALLVFGLPVGLLWSRWRHDSH